jgi:hypothetical protein
VVYIAEFMKLPRRIVLTRLRRVLSWLRASPVRLAVTSGVCFAAYVLLFQVGPWNLSFDLRTIRLAAAALVFGTFLGVVFLAEQMRSPLESKLVRVSAGIAAGLGIALIFSTSTLALAGGASIGAALGYFGQRWANHI